MQKTKRISARITPQVYKKLEQLSKTLGSSISEALMTSIEEYYAQQTFTLKSTKDILKKSGFIGCAENSPTLSQNYKHILSDSFKSKI